MPALMRTSGSNNIYVKLAGASTYLYVGTTEIIPQYAENENYIGVLNSISGQSLPFQEYYQGGDMIVSMLLTRYDETVVSSIRTAPRASAMGSETNLSRGSPSYGVSTFELVIQNTFFGTVNGFASDLQGYRFYYAKYENGQPNPGGTSANKYLLTVKCSSVYNSTTGGFDFFTNTLPSGLTPN